MMIVLVRTVGADGDPHPVDESENEKPGRKEGKAQGPGKVCGELRKKTKYSHPQQQSGTQRDSYMQMAG
jgi:hypothetical protein